MNLNKTVKENLIDYRKAGKNTQEAWFDFKKRNPTSAVSVASFVAGWNAAKAEETTSREEEKYDGKS